MAEVEWSISLAHSEVGFMVTDSEQVARTFDGLSRQQLLIYARELGEHLRNEEGLRTDLSGRERQIREMMAASVMAQEEERQHIAFEVHDRIAQVLAAAFHQMQTLEPLTRADARANAAAIRASSLVREAIRESRNIMNDLHPPGLAEYGPIPLIQDELRRLQEDTGCRARFEADWPERPSHELEVSLYRIFHEAITNVRKHAKGAKTLGVSLVYRNQAVHLEIQDDGPGFDVKAAAVSNHVGGLMSMRRRATILGGSLDIASAPGMGTRLSIHLPANGNKPGR